MDHVVNREWRESKVTRDTKAPLVLLAPRVPRGSRVRPEPPVHRARWGCGGSREPRVLRERMEQMEPRALRCIVRYPLTTQQPPWTAKGVWAGTYPITIGADGLGLISYWDLTNADLKVAHCENAFCSPHFRRR
ncbi:MAG: hypothetical protein C1O27_002468 [Chloroflexi bacterium]|nr:MAG: hypothetical protein C1O27_002468 [Chloroflexota bacterium]